MRFDYYENEPKKGDKYYIIELRYQRTYVDNKIWGENPEEDARLWRRHTDLGKAVTKLYKTEDDAWDAFNDLLSALPDYACVTSYDDEWEFRKWPQWKDGVPKAGDIVYHRNSAGQGFLLRVQSVYGDGKAASQTGGRSVVLAAKHLYPVTILYSDGVLNTVVDTQSVDTTTLL